MTASNMTSQVPGEEEDFPIEILEGSSWAQGRKASEVSQSLWDGEERAEIISVTF